jgi:sec-independent protein translocase protein TatA
MLAMFGMGMQELMIIGVIAVLLFGRKLPEVARSLGSSYREFRKGLNDLQSQINVNDNYSSSSYSARKSSSTPSSSTPSSSPYGDFDDHVEAKAPKFEPPPAEPQPLPSEEIPKNIDEKETSS